MVQIEVKLDASCKEPKIVVVADRMTEQVIELVKKLTEETSGAGARGDVLAGFRGGTAAILDQAGILRVYAAAGKVFAATEDGEYSLRLRLYELEERLDPDRFVRISNSEIVNLRKVRGFDLSFAGTIPSLSDGTTTYVSRRYVARIKQVLGI